MGATSAVFASLFLVMYPYDVIEPECSAPAEVFLDVVLLQLWRRCGINIVWQQRRPAASPTHSNADTSAVTNHQPAFLLGVATITVFKSAQRTAASPRARALRAL